MKLRKTLAAAGALAIAGSAFAMQPSQAADTTVTFVVAAGGISLDHTGATTADLGTATRNVLGSTASGALAEMKITDARGGNFAVTIHSTAGFTDGTTTIAGTAADAYIANAVTDISLPVFTLPALNTSTVLTSATSVLPANLDPANPGELLTGTTVSSGEVVYTPSISIAVPANATAGAYSGVVTQTVS